MRLLICVYGIVRELHKVPTILPEYSLTGKIVQQENTNLSYFLNLRRSGNFVKLSKVKRYFGPFFIIKYKAANITLEGYVLYLYDVCLLCACCFLLLSYIVHSQLFCLEEYTHHKGIDLFTVAVSS